MKTINGRDYYSLYEYLGHAAGASLGDEVNEVAKKQKQKFVQQDVDNPSYTGKVFCYTKEFLEEYFAYKQIIKNYSIPELKNVEDNDDLPF